MFPEFLRTLADLANSVARETITLDYVTKHFTDLLAGDLNEHDSQLLLEDAFTPLLKLTLSYSIAQVQTLPDMTAGIQAVCQYRKFVDNKDLLQKILACAR